MYGALASSQRANDLWVLDVESGEPPVPFNQSEHNETQPAFSPGGDYVAYQSAETGRGEIYVQPYPDGDLIGPVSALGGSEPLWLQRGDQLELVYRETGNRWVVLPMLDGGSFGEPEVLVEDSFRNYPEYNYAVAREGDRLLAIEAPFGPATEIRVVVDWQALLAGVSPEAR